MVPGNLANKCTGYFMDAVGISAVGNDGRCYQISLASDLQVLLERQIFILNEL